MTDPTPEGDASSVTRLLLAWQDGQSDALEELMPLLYDELRRLAHFAMADESVGHTLQTTALVNEAYLRLVGADADVRSRGHFLRIAARAMRQVLVDHARRRNSQKRGENPVHLELGELAPVLGEESGAVLDILAVNEALERLFALDERKARAIELHYFGGLSYDEIADAMEVSEATVHRDLRMARAWLHRELDA